MANASAARCVRMRRESLSYCSEHSKNVKMRRLARIKIVILLVLFTRCMASAKGVFMENPKIFVSVNKFDKEWEITLLNSSPGEVHGVFADNGIPMEFGIEFWDDETRKGLRIFGPGAKLNVDGFTSSVYSIKPGKSYTFKFSPEEAWSENDEIRGKWKKLCESGYFHCRVFIKSFASPLYSVHFKDGEIEGAHLNLNNSR